MSGPCEVVGVGGLGGWCGGLGGWCGGLGGVGGVVVVGGFAVRLVISSITVIAEIRKR